MNIKYEFDISAILPEGKLNAKIIRDATEYSWDHTFTSPIVSIWKWNGQDLEAVNVFKTMPKTEMVEMPHAIYLGMHNKQVCSIGTYL